MNYLSKFLYGFILLLLVNSYCYGNQNNLSILKQASYEAFSTESLNHLLSRVENKEIVLIGDSTHGTHEFYKTRAELSKHLITKLGFSLIGIEAAWKDVYQINQYIHSQSDLSLKDVFSKFQDYPVWMWKNKETVEFISWLKDYNIANPYNRISFYGIDIYERKHGYSIAGSETYPVNHEQDLYQYMVELGAYNRQRGDVLFAQNNSNKGTDLYRADDTIFWNNRDQHMFDALMQLREYHQTSSDNQDKKPATIVWAHNSHSGDARAINKSVFGQKNLSQYLREKFQDKIYTIGMFTYQGEVMASDRWDGPHFTKRMKLANINSVEGLFHQMNISPFILETNKNSKVHDILKQPRLTRHIGVIYEPDREYQGHYVKTQLADEFDLIFFFNQTGPVHLY